MKYKIVGAHKEIGQIEVQYTENGKVFGVYALDVPVVDGAFMTGQALHDEIMHRAPTWAVERSQQIQSASGFDTIAALVQKPDAPTIDPEARANAEMWEQLQYEAKLVKALMKFGVLQSDPTLFEVTQL